MMKVMASAKSTTSHRLGQAPLLFSAAQVQFFSSSGLKGDYFKREEASGEIADALVNDPTAFADEKRSQVPPSTTLKQQIRDLVRTEDEGNLYSVFKP